MAYAEPIHAEHVTANPTFEERKRIARQRDFPADRRCTHVGCITILSRSNPGPQCRIHTQPRREDETTATEEGW